MRNVFTFLLAIIFYGNLWAQCPPGDVMLMNQQQVDDFASAYPECSELSGSLEIGFGYPADITNLNGLINITSIAGELTIFGNDYLPTLTGLDNLNFVGGDLYIGWNGLGILTGLDNLSTIGGNLNLDNNDFLITLTGLEGLTSIGGDFILLINGNLASLAGMENVVSIGGNVSITIQPDLSFCSVPVICSHILNGFPYEIDGNESGCDDANEVLALCGDLSYVDVFTFYDTNQNGTQDIDEPNMNGFTFQIAPQNAAYTANNGTIVLVPGDYTVAFDQSANADWTLTTDSSSYTVSLAAYERDSLEFGVFPNTFTSDIASFINSPNNRCNEEIIFDISTRNLGTTTASGTLWFTVDQDVVNVDFIDLPDTTIAASNTYGWYFTDLFSGQTITKQAVLTIPGPPDFELGDFLNYITYTDYTDVNGDNTSEAFRYEAEVRCSFDPNDKLVHPAREGDYTLFDENIIYTIRFQNTGNDVAYDVVVRDTLDTNLDLESFNVLGSSHPNKLSTSLTSDGMLTFEFIDIFLPDSTSNLEGSQGYVTYMISAIDGLAENTPITNSAGIYFDFNPPIITNTTQNVMVSELPTVSTTLPDSTVDFIISPNPNTGIFQVNGIPQGTYQIQDTAGRIIQSGNMKNDLSIDISTEAQGVYFISIQMDNEVITKRNIKL